MRRFALALLAMMLVAAAIPAKAETEADRLREAIRTMTGQLRALEDQRVQAQAKLAQSEREKTNAIKAAEQLRGQLKAAQAEQQAAVEEFNRRLAVRDDTLEKWKSAYAEAAGVAREKDALRAKFEEEAGNFKSRTKSCEAKNLKLLKVNGEILAAYRDLTPLDAALINEPLIGFSRVDHQNRVQEFHDKIIDQDVRSTPRIEAEGDGKKPPDTKAPETKPASNARPKAAEASKASDAKSSDVRPVGQVPPPVQLQ